MNKLFQSVRALFGQNTIASEWQPVDELQKAIDEHKVAQFELIKAQQEFDQINRDYALKFQACDTLIEKGYDVGKTNKQLLIQRLDGITDDFLNNTKQLIDSLAKAEQARVQLESDMIAKAIQVVAQLDQQDQSIIKDIIDVWQETGLVKGEEVSSQAKAITLAIEEIVKGGIGSGRYDHHKRKIAEHERERNQILREQENDPDIHAEDGAGGRATDSYGKRLNEIDKKIQHHRSKINEIKDQQKAKEAQQKIDAENAEKERVARWDRAYAEAHSNISKGGEGSRGGKVIGHTKSGKPIYDTFHHPGHESFTIEDHKDAVDVHERNRLSRRVGNPEGARHKKAAQGLSYDDEKGWIKKSHEPIAIELAGKGDIVYDSPVEGHYANVIIKDKDGKILFLKRAANKVVEPNKFCLPGGHIDKGETIEQAALRELKEEANIECNECYLIGKIKCGDGKWAFYVSAYPKISNVMLLDGESVNAAWMANDEWIEADLLFDLKDHLVAMETKTQSIDSIPDILKKAEGLEKGGYGSGRHKGPGSLATPRHGWQHPDDWDDEKITDPSNYKLVKYLQDELDSLRPKGKGVKTYVASTNSPNMGYRTFIDIDTGSNRETEEKSYEVQHKLMDLSIKLREKHPELRTYVASTKSDNMGMRTFIDVDIQKAQDEKLEKAIDIDNPFYYNNEEELIKGRAAAEGEERTWNGKRYKKTAGKWMPVKSGKKDPASKQDDERLKKITSQIEGLESGGLLDDDGEERLNSLKKEFREISGSEYKTKGKQQPKLSTKQLKEHVENTSTDQLKKVAENKEHPHNDAAKRELERRAGEEGSKQDKRKILNDFKKEISKVLEENHYDTDNPKVQKVLDKYMEMDTNVFDSDELNEIIDQEVERSDQKLEHDADHWYVGHLKDIHKQASEGFDEFLNQSDKNLYTDRAKKIGKEVQKHKEVFEKEKDSYEKKYQKPWSSKNNKK